MSNDRGENGEARRKQDEEKTEKGDARRETHK